jgi:Secretion system C-terminal sorting domain
MKNLIFSLFFLFTVGFSTAQVFPPTSLKTYANNQGNWELSNWNEFRYHPNGKLASITEIDSVANAVLSSRFFEYDSLNRLILDSSNFLVSIGNYAYDWRKFEYGPNGKVIKLEGKSNDPNNSYQNTKEYWYIQGFRGFSSSIKTINSASFDTLNRYIRSPFYDTLYFFSNSLGIYQKFKVDRWKDSSELIPAVYTSLNAQGQVYARDSGSYNSNGFPIFRRIFAYQNNVPTGFYDNTYSYFPSIPTELFHQPNPELPLNTFNGLPYARGAVAIQPTQGGSDSDFQLQYGVNQRIESYIRRNNTQGNITDTKVIFGYGRLASTKQEPFNSMVFPNPFRDYLQIQAPVGASISITDLSGRVLKGFVFEGELVNTDSFPPGVFILMIQKGNRMEAHKLIKL